jgi:hypothetical protein
VSCSSSATSSTCRTSRRASLDALLHHREPKLLEPRDRSLREGHAAEIGECRAAPDAERLAEQLRSRLRSTLSQCERPLLGEPLEPTQIELVGWDVQHVTGRAGLDCRLRAQHLTEVGDLPLHLGDGGGGRGTRVEIVGEAVDRHDAVRTEEEDRESRALSRTSEPKRLAVSGDLERPQDPELEHARPSGLRSPRVDRTHQARAGRGRLPHAARNAGRQADARCTGELVATYLWAAKGRRLLRREQHRPDHHYLEQGLQDEGRSRPVLHHQAAEEGIRKAAEAVEVQRDLRRRLRLEGRQEPPLRLEQPPHGAGGRTV